ncbi:hypothetical protein EZS27_014192 [termite gut metagenome]|uniref:Uncharacterized protein n=1 Tax=termite gut metagenome TaxID=433724 RepID=A0A5J4RXQ2_9ZZZZ
MNAIQKSVYEQYPTYMEFINAQEPEQMLLNYDNIHSIKEAISVIRLSVSEMNEIYGGDLKSMLL